MNKISNDLKTKVFLTFGVLFSLTLAALLFFYASRPIMDPDFWWHLKTGEAMVQQGGLLYSDPFTFHESIESTTREAVILRGYWLWQISSYALYSHFGFNGIFILKLLIISAIAGTIVLQLRRQRLNLGLAAPLLTASFILLGSYALERPQVASFFFASLLVGLLMQVHRDGRLGFSVPIVMCLWANVHGGFVVGDLILLCFSIGVMVEYRHDLTRMKTLLSWAVAGIGASLLNPNGGLVFVELFRFYESSSMNMVTEYRSTWTAFADGAYVFSLLWLMIILYLLAVALLRRVFWPEFLVAIFLAYFSIKHERNAPFFALALLPVIGSSWQQLMSRWKSRAFPFFNYISTILAILALLWFMPFDLKSWQPNARVKAIYPEAAINFIQNNKLQGRMFNSYEYGGYLLWRLSPESRVFIDGRGISPKVFDDYKKISQANAYEFNGENDYQALLNSYKIDYVIQTIYDGFGNVQPLMKALLPKPEWVPIYLDTQVYILAKLVEDNKNVIEVHQIDKTEFKKRLLLIYDYLLRTNPQEIGFRVARAGMLIYLGDYDEAKKEVDVIAKINPNDKSIPALQRDLYALARRLAR